jgi:hypothetical protein
MRIALRVCAAIAALALVPSSAGAQTAPPLRHLELSGGFGIVTGAALGQQDANLRTATPDTPFRLFTTTSRMSGAPILDLRAGTALTRRYGVEAHASYGHPEVRTSISSDAEGAPDLTAVERLDEYVIDGGVVFRFEEWTFAGLTPFATVGGGYLRQLHEDLVAIEEGSVFFVGGGVKRAFVTRPRGWWHALGARADARLNILSGGITIDDRTRRHLAVSGSLFVVF